MHLGKGWLCEVSIGPVGQTDYVVSKAGRTQTAVFRECYNEYLWEPGYLRMRLYDR